MTSWTKKSLLTEAAKGSVVTIVVTEPRKSLVKSEKVLDMAEAVSAYDMLFARLFISNKSKKILINQQLGHLFVQNRIFVI